MAKLTRRDWYLIGAYLAILAGLAGGMLYARREVLQSLDTPEARQNWKIWRDEAEKRDALVQKARGNDPANRRATRTFEPPVLVLMRDHFAKCLGMMLLVASLMFGVFAFLLRGAAVQRQ